MNEDEKQETEDVSSVLESFSHSLANFSQETNQKLEELKNQFNQKIFRDEKLKEAFDKLYEEMKQYKENFLFEAMRPVLTDLLLLHDNVIRFQKSLEDSKAKEAMNIFQEEILEILYRRDIEPILLPESTKVDRKIQRVVKTIPADTPSEEGDIVEVVREGFWRGEKVFRLQDIVCKKYRNSAEESLRKNE